MTNAYDFFYTVIAPLLVFQFQDFRFHHCCCLCPNKITIIFSEVTHFQFKFSSFYLDCFSSMSSNLNTAWVNGELNEIGLKRIEDDNLTCLRFDQFDICCSSRRNITPIKKKETAPKVPRNVVLFFAQVYWINRSTIL